ncbi:MAG TPA: hypothetical protein VJX66_27045 [Amycolatopsis sp.]|nr:hypothetical protein [Amycolatopsis sp.]
MSSWRRWALIVLLVFGSAGLAVPARADDAACATPIARARALPLGTVVTIDGAATTPSGAFESSFFDKGFAVQDRSAGIYVSIATDPHVVPGDRVRVTGALRDSFGLLVLVPDSMPKVHGKGPQVRPEHRATGAVNENSEGRLVRVYARITQAPVADPPYGSKFFVNDGSGELTIFINTQTGIDPSGLAVGRLVVVTGFSSQFDTHYEIDPRFPSDIKNSSRLPALSNA